jgi:putative tryptophan/tyrosine transport system substrate-binding protein
MNRREFIAGLGGAVAWPVGVRAQRAANPVIGFFTVRYDLTDYAASVQGLKECGYVEGQNGGIEYGSGAEWSSSERRREFVNSLVRKRVAVIFAPNDGPALVAKRATSDIPIVFSAGSDPVKLGLVPSINRPDGNVTGVGFGNVEFAAKRLDLLCQLVPAAATVAYLTDPRGLSSEEERDHYVAAADALGRQLIIQECSRIREIEHSVATLVERGATAFTVGVQPIFINNPEAIVAAAAQNKIPAMYAGRQFVSRGGLMSYSWNGREALQIAAGLVCKILDGTNPADLPVRRATRFDFVINLKAAKQIGLEIPQHLLVFADEVIEIE